MLKKSPSMYVYVKCISAGQAIARDEPILRYRQGQKKYLRIYT